MSDIYTPGYLEVICGPMKSGKTGRLILELKRLDHTNLNYIAFKPDIDNRFSEDKLVSRGMSEEIDAKILNSENPWKGLEDYVLKDIDVFAFDEANFFSNELIKIVRDFQVIGKGVLVSGLDLDFKGEPFGPMSSLLAMADKVVKLPAACDYEGCGKRANRTQRLIDGKPAHYNSPLILVGDQEYEARCLEHREVPRD